LLKDDLNKAAVQIAFVHEDNQCRHHQEESPGLRTASECAQFDECIFSGLAKYKATSQADLRPPALPPLVPVPTSVPTLDLEGDSDVEVIAPHIPHTGLPFYAAPPERTLTIRIDHLRFR